MAVTFDFLFKCVIWHIFCIKTATSIIKKLLFFFKYSAEEKSLIFIVFMILGSKFVSGSMIYIDMLGCPVDIIILSINTNDDIAQLIIEIHNMKIACTFLAWHSFRPNSNFRHFGYGLKLVEVILQTCFKDFEMYFITLMQYPGDRIFNLNISMIEKKRLTQL